MKAKSKVLLGLLVALAMVVMAVPAFAASTFTVPSVTPQNEGVAYVGGKAKIDVTINTETPADAEGPYTVTITDTTKKADGSAAITDLMTFAPVTVADADIQATNTVTLESGNITESASNPDAIGEHTFKVVVKDHANGTIEYDKEVKIEVKAGLTANFSGYKTVTGTSTEYELPSPAKVGDTFNLNGLVEGGEGPYSFSWQMSSARTGADTAKKDVAGWTEFSTEQNPVYVAAQADAGKFVRLVVTDADENVVVATGADAISASAAAVNKATVKLPTTINNTGAITFKNPETATSVTKVVGQSTELITANAEGGTGTITYKWYKDGEEINDTTIAEGPALKAITNVTEENAGVYTCVATDESTPAVTATSPAYTLNVKKAPSYELTSSVGTVSTTQKATWGATATETAGSGTLYLTKEQAANDVKLTLNIENALDKDAAITWSGTGIESTTAANKTEVTLTGPVAPANDRTVKVSYPGYGLTASTGYVLDIVVTDGTLTATNGGIFKAAGTSDPTVSPVYTITLPEGVVFNEDITAGTLVSWIQNKPTGLAVEVQTGTGENQSNTVSFTLDNSKITAGTPSVENMEIKIDQNKLTPNTSPVVLPVSEDIGWEITSTLADNDIKVDPDTATYTGEELPATIVADTTKIKAEDLGEIEAVYYAPSTEADKTKATEDVPTDAGTYNVWADVAASKAYPAAEKVAAGTYTISPVTLSKTNAKTYLDWVEEKEYTGDVLDAEVAFKDSFTKTGKVKKVEYKDAKGNVVQPTNKGVYTMFLTTESDGETNPATNISPANKVEIGTFTITGKKPTADLYTIKPTEVTYNEAEQGTNVTKADEAAGNVKAVYYYPEGSDEPLEGLPVNAGVYTVKIDTEESDVYAATEEGKPLEIGTFTIKEDKPEQQDIYMIGHVENIGWGEAGADGKGDGKAVKLEAGKSAQVGTTGRSLRVEAVTILVPADYTVEGFAHVEDFADLDVEKETDDSYITNKSEIPEGYVAYKFGTSGKAKRVEAINIAIKDADGKYVEGFEYATHVQNQGWLGSVRNGSFSGSRGQALRMEAIRFYYDDVIRKPTDIDAETK